MEESININLKSDKDVKQSMKQICSEVSVDPFYSENNIRYLEKKMAEYKAGNLKLTEHELIED